ncbi:MAG: chemotaxis protein CheC [Candidatus Omnitrophica bacterium]|nr:chemotaxis protein CheC [Candidatus Omnitrophota bacterium]
MMENGRDVADRAIQLVARLSIDKSSQVLSKMVKTGAYIEMERAYVGDISEISTVISENYTDIVGAFIDLQGDMPCKFLFFVDAQDSMALADMLLRRPAGTTKEFNEYTISAIQEIGNVLASAISNVFSADLQIKMKPSPPEVVHDFAGTIFQEYIRTVAGAMDEIMIIESKFRVVKVDMRCNMFIVPQASIEAFFQMISKVL